MSLMLSLCFVAKPVSVHYFIWKWLQMPLTRLSHKMSYLSSLQLKFPMKLKLKDITYIKTYGHQSWGAIVGHLEKGKSGRFANTKFYYLRSHPQANCTAKVTGKRFNLGDGKGLQVSCILQFTGERKFISVLKEQFNLLKEKK